jgi:hypothetical protein
VLRSDDIAHPVCGIGCVPLRQSGRDDGQALASNAPIAATRVKTKRAGRIKIYWEIGSSLTESRERVRDDFERPLQCFEPPLAIASMRPLARMAEDGALDVLFDGW